jgi:hypothetical protein
LRDAVGIGGDGARIAADADCRAGRALGRGRAVVLEDLLAAGEVVLLDQVGVDRGRARVAAEGEGVARRVLVSRGIVVLVDLLAAAAQVGLIDRIGVQRERVGRTEDAVRGRGRGLGSRSRVPLAGRRGRQGRDKESEGGNSGEEGDALGEARSPMPRRVSLTGLNLRRPVHARCERRHTGTCFFSTGRQTD